MPPAISDDETSDVDAPFPEQPWRPEKSAASEDSSKVDSPRPKRGASKKAPEPIEDANENDSDDGGEEMDDDVFIVEAILQHMIDEDGTLKFQVKWEGWDDKNDLTWEPEENLTDSAVDILSEYLERLGGRDNIFQQRKTAKGRKRGRPSAAADAPTKRSRANGTHPDQSTPPATVQKWSPPAGSWEDEIELIDAREDEETAKLVVYLTWKNGKKTKHDTSVIYKKCPQKMLQFYERHVRIIRDDDRADA